MDSRNSALQTMLNSLYTLMGVVLNTILQGSSVLAKSRLVLGKLKLMHWLNSIPLVIIITLCVVEERRHFTRPGKGVYLLRESPHFKVLLCLSSTCLWRIRIRVRRI